MSEDIVKLYMNDIGQAKLLTPDEEKNLALLAAKNNSAAKDELIKSNLKLVVSIARKYIGNGISFSDLIQEGNIGLMTAVDKFDANLGYKFSTYAYYWIKTAISRAVNQQNRSIRMPVYMIEKLSKYKKVEQELSQKNGVAPSINEIAKAMSIPVKEAKELQEYFMDTVSLDAAVGDEEDTTLGSFVEDTSEKVNPEEHYENEDMKAVLNNVLNTLSDRESGILKMRFGVGYASPMTLEEVGKQYNITRERVRQIEASALKKMRNPMRADKLRDYL